MIKICSKKLSDFPGQLDGEKRVDFPISNSIHRVIEKNMHSRLIEYVP